MRVAGPAPDLADRLERNRNAVDVFFHRARSLDPAVASTPRAPGKWTPAQEVAHLVRAYAEFTAVLAGGPEFELMVPPARAVEYQRTVLPRILAGSWFPSGAAAPLRLQIPSSPVDLTSALTDLSKAVADLETAVRAAHDADPERRVIHPYFRSMSLADLVGLLAAHTRHHTAFLPLETT